MNTSIRSALFVVVAVVPLAAACGGQNSGGDAATVSLATTVPVTTVVVTTTVVPTTTTPAPLTSLTYAAFGDSHSYGSPEQCGNCVTYPHLLEGQIATATGLPVTLIDATQHNGLTASLLKFEFESDQWKEPPGIPHIRTDLSPREVVDRADVITISVGMNDTPWYSGPSCGDVYDDECIRAGTAEYRSNIDAILAEIEEIRAGRPTAVRIISVFNDLIAGGGYESLWFYKPAIVDQALTGGAALVAAWTSAVCESAAAHSALCIDVNSIFNGPTRDQPMSGGYFATPLIGDLNQRGHDEIASAIIALGFPELSGS